MHGVPRSLTTAQPDAAPGHRAPVTQRHQECLLGEGPSPFISGFSLRKGTGTGGAQQCWWWLAQPLQLTHGGFSPACENTHQVCCEDLCVPLYPEERFSFASFYCFRLTVSCVDSSSNTQADTSVFSSCLFQFPLVFPAIAAAD